MTPSSIEEWGQYVAQLSGEPLWSKAIAANTLAFVKSLQEEGAEPSMVVNVLLMFAMRLEQDGQAVPTDMPGQYLSFLALLASAEAESGIVG